MVLYNNVLEIKGLFPELVQNDFQRVQFITNKYYHEFRNEIIEDSVKRNDETLLRLAQNLNKLNKIAKLSKLQRKITAQTYAFFDYINGRHIKGEVFSNYQVLNTKTNRNYYLDILINKNKIKTNIESDTKTGHYDETQNKSDQNRDIYIKDFFKDIYICRLREKGISRLNTSDTINVSRYFSLGDTKKLYTKLCAIYGYFYNPDDIIEFMENNSAYDENFFLTDEELEVVFADVFKRPEQLGEFANLFYGFYANKFKIENFVNM